MKTTKKAISLELPLDEMQKMGEAALQAAIDHILKLPQSPSHNLENAREVVASLKEQSPEKGSDFDSLLELLMTKVIPFRFRPQRGDVEAFSRKLLKNINGTKKLYLSSTLLRGEFAIRVFILGFRTHM